MKLTKDEIQTVRWVLWNWMELFEDRTDPETEEFWLEVLKLAQKIEASLKSS